MPPAKLAGGGSSELALANSSNSNSKQPTTRTKVKLCGYLKKKRSKVGGWRKLWFVLQDKLLLSYSSKEEYDNKLVSFKDVLNLVPGTMVRPLGGFRFTIETTTQAIYTFHCDDRVAYREWMTMLLDSLATQPQLVQQKFAHYYASAAATPTPMSMPMPAAQSASMDSIPHALALAAKFNAPLNRYESSSCSYDSISQVERRGSAAGVGVGVGVGGAMLLPPYSLNCVRMPIAQNTAKLLERNGVNSSQELPQTLFGNRRQALLPAATATATAQQLELCAAVQHFRLRPAHEAAAAFGRHKSSAVAHTSDGKAYDLVKERIQRLSIRGSTSMQQQLQRAKLMTTSSVEQVIMRLPNGDGDESNNNTKSCRSCFMEQQQEQRKETELEPEPVYAVVDLQHKYAQRRLRGSSVGSGGSAGGAGLQQKRCNSYDSVLQAGVLLKETRLRSSLAEDDIDGIYEDGDKLFGSALVTRLPAKLRLNQRANDAEEDDDEENIYEPINIAASYAQPSSRAFWKYFSRLKVKPLLQLSRLSKRSTKDYDAIKLPMPMPKTKPKPSVGESQPSQGLVAATSSHLASIRHKFGTQRKSLRARMRKLCARGYEPQPLCQSSAPANASAAAAAPASSSNYSKKLRQRWRTVKLRPRFGANVASAGALEEETQRKLARRFFSGSLPLLRKSAANGRQRMSLFPPPPPPPPNAAKVSQEERPAAAVEVSVEVSS